MAPGLAIPGTGEPSPGLVGLRDGGIHAQDEIVARIIVFLVQGFWVKSSISYVRPGNQDLGTGRTFKLNTAAILS